MRNLKAFIKYARIFKKKHLTHLGCMCENSRKTGLLTSSGALNASSSSAWKSDILTSFNVYDYNSRHCGLKIGKKVQFLPLKSQHSISINSSI